MLARSLLVLWTVGMSAAQSSGMTTAFQDRAVIGNYFVIGDHGSCLVQYYLGASDRKVFEVSFSSKPDAKGVAMTIHFLPFTGPLGGRKNAKHLMESKISVYKGSDRIADASALSLGAESQYSASGFIPVDKALRWISMGDRISMSIRDTEEPSDRPRVFERSMSGEQDVVRWVRACLAR